MQARSIGYLCLALAMTSVGSTVVASRLAGDGLPPFTATSLRFLIAFPLLLLLMRVSGAGFPRLGMRDLALLLVQAGAGSTGYTVLLILGTRLTPAADAGVMLGTLPAMSTLLAALVLNEKLSSRDWFAALLATAGAMVIALRRGDTTLSAGALAGNALVLLAVACEALYILLNKRLRVPLAPLTQSTVMAGFGLVLALLPALLVERGWSGGSAAADATAISAVAYYALVPTVIGFLLWYAGTARTTGAQASLFTAFAPVSAMLLSALILGEVLTPARLVGIALVLAGVLTGAAPWRMRRAR